MAPTYGPFAGARHIICWVFAFLALGAAEAQAYSLPEAVALGRSMSPRTVRDANAVNTARSNVEIERSRWLPQANFQTSISYTESSFPLTLFGPTSTVASISLQQAIPLDWPWEWGKSTANIEAARMLESAAKLNLEAGTINTSIEIVNAYFRVLLAREQEMAAFNSWQLSSQIWAVARERAEECITKLEFNPDEVIPVVDTPATKRGSYQEWSLNEEREIVSQSGAMIVDIAAISPKLTSCSELISDERQALAAAERNHKTKRDFQLQLRNTFYDFMVDIGENDNMATLEFSDEGRPLLPPTFDYPATMPRIPGDDGNGGHHYEEGLREAIATALAYSPVMQAAREQVSGFEQRYRGAEEIFDPRLSVRLSASRSELHDRDSRIDSATAMLVLEIPLADGGLRRARKSIAADDVSNSRTSVIEIERSLRRKLNGLYNFFGVAEDNIRGTRDSIRSTVAVNQQRINQYLNGTLPGNISLGQMLGGIDQETGLRFSLANQETLLWVNRYDVLSATGDLLRELR